MNKFITEQMTIELLQKDRSQFIVPPYQRPYVWEDEEVLKLLEDIYDSAFTYKRPQYFIGNVFVTKTGDRSFDIIDGQQRFTTLWLTALAFRQIGIKTEFSSFIGTENALSINFAIRKEVEQYLKSLLQVKSFFSNEEISQNEFLKNIAKAGETIKGFITQQSEDIATRFANYIYKNVIFIYNTAPKGTDLNSLFTSLGNSGVQLEQTDILKSLLLKNVDKKIVYSKIWEACENMNDFFENNVLSIFPKTKKINLENLLFSKFDESVFLLNEPSLEVSKTNVNGKSISEILTDEVDDIKVISNTNSYENKLKCRPIIPFSTLLLHTYRIFRNHHEQGDFFLPVDKKHLLEIFESLTKSHANSIKEFIELLWQVRFLFDYYIIKWRFDNDGDGLSDEEEKLRLTSISIQDASLLRQNKPNSKISMLQSVLFYTGGYNQQYWISPFLKYLLSQPNQKDDVILTELEKIDNLMLPGEKKDTSWKLMDVQERNVKVENIENRIGECLGTGFNHYWFYKLEYLLWKDWDAREDLRFKNYRITSKNSIEHVYPQNPEYSEPIEKKSLDSFGNLGLLSVGQNSSYSYKEVAKKKIDFDRKGAYDSLKLAKIYSSANISNWGPEEIENHKNEMLLTLTNHYL